jgi:hypothetical protein
LGFGFGKELISFPNSDLGRTDLINKLNLFENAFNKLKRVIMRYLMLIMVFFMLPNVFFAQQTYVPDDNFEQALIDMGYDSPPLNDSVPTANIETVGFLDVARKKISDLTGIEDFKYLKELFCYNNDLTSLDLSSNTALLTLICWRNNLTSLDVSKNSALEYLSCWDNNLTSLDLSNNSDLSTLYCWDNNLTSLDLSNNSVLVYLDCGANNLESLDVRNNSALVILNCSENHLKSLDVSNNLALESLWCSVNRLKSLNIKNGNNKNMTGDLSRYYFSAIDNPDLYCIQVDDSAWSAKAEKWEKDDHAVYSEDCGYTGVEEFLTPGTEISIFPNPAGSSFVVSFELETPKTLTMTLTDLSGRELQEFTLENKQFVNEEIDVSMLSPGVYFLNISFGNESISRKIVVK